MFEGALLERVGWIEHEGRAWAQLDAACGGKDGDVGEGGVRTGYGRDVGVDASLVGMGWLESIAGGRRGVCV